MIKQKNDRMIKIACVGDSLTWGQMLLDKQTGASYPNILQALLGNEWFEVGNFGASGRSMSEGYREPTWERTYCMTEQYQQSLAFGADIVILCLGTNDAGKCDVTSEEGKRNFLNSAAHLIDAYKNAGAKQIYLCLPPYNEVHFYLNKLKSEVLPLLHTVAQQHRLEIIDFFSVTNGKSELVLSDHLHLTDAGYAVMANTVYQALLKNKLFTYKETTMKFQAKAGVYPTMITPYTKSGEVDYGAVEALTEWYWSAGCNGIFADCQSSEIQFLTLEERVRLLRTVLDKTNELAKKDPTRERMMIVASGHVSDAFEDQVRELNALAAEGPDALILISNRMDIANTTDEAWIEDTKKLIAALPEDMPLGVYECPKPYKRLMSKKMLAWCAESGRFYFLKDTCCDADIIKERAEICKETKLAIFNANAQTLLQSLKDGGVGYCGVMANIHPELYVKLMSFSFDDPKAVALQSFLGLAALVEPAYTYPCCAKYYLDRHVGIPMEWAARSADVSGFTPYQQACMDQLAELTKVLKENLF